LVIIIAVILMCVLMNGQLLVQRRWSLKYPFLIQHVLYPLQDFQYPQRLSSIFNRHKLCAFQPSQPKDLLLILLLCSLSPISKIILRKP
jgi:hypothetical protein